MRIARALLLALAALLVVQSSNAWADNPGTMIRDLEHSLEERLQPLLQRNDPQAFSVVQIESVRGKEHGLPGTPYILKNLVIESDSGRLPIGKVSVTVFNSAGALSDDSVAFLKQLVPTMLAGESSRGIQVDIKVEKISGEFSKSAPNSTAEAITHEGATLKDGFAALADPIGKFKQLFFTFSVILAASLLASVLVFGLILRVVFASAARSVTQSLDRFASVLESWGGSPAAGASSVETAGSRSADWPATLSSSGSAEGFGDYPVDVLLECLFDCYWCHEDGYAAYLWKRLGIAKRQEILAVSPVLGEYAAYLRGIPEADLDALGDPSYVTPAGFRSLDQEALTEMIRKNPALYHEISEMRRDGLGLSAAERLKLGDPPLRRGPRQLPGRREIEPSAPRVLEGKSKILVKTLDEERELMNLADVPPEKMRRVQSLVWALKLPNEAIARILSGFSARELAMAWIAPEEVLEGLSRNLPKKKLELIQSLLKRTRPSRGSPEFWKLHQRIMESLSSVSEKLSVPGGPGDSGDNNESDRKAA